MKNKIRLGVIGIILGLIAIFGALYLDQIHGTQRTSFGLYQIVGVFLGYMILGAGLVLTLQDVEASKSIQKVLYIGGGVIGAVSVLADHLGVASPAGFDRYQIIGLVFGAALAGLGFILPPGLF